MLADRYVVVSDLHLGRPDGLRSPSELDAILEPGACLVLNGDSAELRDPQHREAAEVALADLRARARGRGASLVMLAGNHDPDIAPERMMSLAGGTVIVTHGDAFHPSVAPWSARAAAMRSAWNETLDALPPELRGTVQATFAAARAAGRAEVGVGASHTTLRRLLTSPSALLSIMMYWRAFPALAARFAETFAASASIVVAGHSHWHGVSRVGQRTIVNTGAFAPPRAPHAAIIERDRLALVRLRFVAGSYRFADSPQVVIALPAPLDGSPAFMSLEDSARPNCAAIPFPASSSSERSTRVASPDRSHV
jgi:predicted phosphodiesterase